MQAARKIIDARYGVPGLGHDAFRDLLEVLGGPCTPQIVGWCELELDGLTHAALVVTQAWPFLPLGTDPRPIMKARRYAALISNGDGIRVVAISEPPSAGVGETTSEVTS